MLTLGEPDKIKLCGHWKNCRRKNIPSAFQFPSKHWSRMIRLVVHFCASIQPSRRRCQRYIPDSRIAQSRQFFQNQIPLICIAGSVVKPLWVSCLWQRTFLRWADQSISSKFARNFLRSIGRSSSPFPFLFHSEFLIVSIRIPPR